MVEVLAIPTAVPFGLKVMVAAVFIIAVLLMIWLTVKIYKNEARNEDAGPKNTGW